MVRWLRWHCPPDTGFEIRALAVWGRARYLSVTEASHNTDFHKWMGKKHFLFPSNRRDREPNPQLLAWKAAVLTTTLGPPPSNPLDRAILETRNVQLMLGHRSRLQTNVKPTLGQHLDFTKLYYHIFLQEKRWYRFTKVWSITKNQIAWIWINTVADESCF